jgi:hypothetical protein
VDVNKFFLINSQLVESEGLPIKQVCEEENLSTLQELVVTNATLIWCNPDNSGPDLIDFKSIMVYQEFL